MNLQSATDAFIQYLHNTKSPRTATSYAVALRKFIAHIGDVDTTALSADAVESFAKSLTSEKTFAPSTSSAYLAAVIAFCHYALQHRLIVLDAAESERLFAIPAAYRRAEQRLPILPTDEFFNALIQAAQDESIPDKPACDHRNAELRRARNLAILEMLRSSGMRVGELVKIKRGDLDYRSKSARVIGKRNKERIVFFSEPAWTALQSYLKLRHDGEQGRALAELPVLCAHSRRANGSRSPLTTRQIQRIFVQLADRANIDLRYTPHKFRHWFATHLLESSGDLAIVQDALGHASPATTRIYAKVSQRRLAAAHRAAFA